MIKKYYSELVNRVFNILYIYENNPCEFKDYVDSLVFELSGNDEFLEIHQIRFRLNALVVGEVEHIVVKKAVFKSISILDRILSNWKE